MVAEFALPVAVELRAGRAIGRPRLMRHVGLEPFAGAGAEFPVGYRKLEVHL
jgi:hypothetical protein